MVAKLAPVQLWLGVLGGAEAVIHALRRYAEEDLTLSSN